MGICLGLQLMCRYTEEGDTKCLGIFDTDVRLFPPVDKIPHMGWNNFLTMKGELFKGVDLEDNVYYVHSYYAEISSCTTCYMRLYSSIQCIDAEVIISMQHSFILRNQLMSGEKILKNFLESMRIIVALDIIDGKCVRLTQGDFNTKKVYNEDPLEVARQIEDNGLNFIHLVDLDGAKNKKIENIKVLEKIAWKTKSEN